MCKYGTPSVTKLKNNFRYMTPSSRYIKSFPEVVIFPLEVAILHQTQNRGFGSGLLRMRISGSWTETVAHAHIITYSRARWEQLCS